MNKLGQTVMKNDAAETLFHNRQTMLRFNEYKVARTLQTLSDTDRMIFISIPRLLHVHQPGLPGYIEGSMPHGIYNYPLTKECQVATETLFPDLIIRRTESSNPVIHSVILIGSLGSIAQTKKSDLDYTLLVNKDDFSKESMALFKKKLNLIEKWTWDTYHLETHFFVNDVEDVKRNIFGESDSESTGSALAKLLKEEMYRTMIVVTGRIPFWLVVPVETDDEQYNSLYDMLNSHKTLLSRNEFVDMGNVEDISKGEFFGGSIWALIKSFKAPFKTLMKMGVLEEYMFEETKCNLLCHEVKKNLINGTPYLSIDPYIMMYNRVENYFKKTKTENEIDALRTAFYLKVGRQVNNEEMENGSPDVKKSMLIDIVKKWEWSPSKLEEINSYADWHMTKKVDLGNRVNKIMMNSYKLISEKNKTLGSASMISEKDTHLLGRKLFSYYRQAPNKVENVFALIDGKASEKELTFLFHQENERDKGEWYLIRRKTMHYLEQIPKEDIMKRAATLQFLITFAAFNNLYDPNTTILLRAEHQSLKDHDLHFLLDQISVFIARVNIANISNDDLMAAATIKQLYIIVDFGPTLPREILTGDIRECKSAEEYNVFINKRLERVATTTAIYLTSWGELFCKTFAGVANIVRCLSELGPQIPIKQYKDPNFLKIYIPCGRRELFEIPWLNSYMLRFMQSKSAASAEKAAS